MRKIKLSRKGECARRRGRTRRWRCYQKPLSLRAMQRQPVSSPARAQRLGHESGGVNGAQLSRVRRALLLRS